MPITGRKQNILVSDEQVLSLSNQEYQKYMQTAKPSTNATNTAMVKRVGQNLANAVVSYLRQNGLGAEVSQYKWEFNLVQDKSVNAFCMPGGKIVVFEGILPVTKDEARTFILANESDDRRYYSGYAGPWGIKDVYALYVSLRCMEIREDCCLMHAGGGLLPTAKHSKPSPFKRFIKNSAFFSIFITLLNIETAGENECFVNIRLSHPLDLCHFC